MNELNNIYDREIDTRGNGSQVYTERYSEDAVERLKNLILTFFSQGEKKFYAISVDGEIVLPKTYDGRKFDQYLHFVNQHTKTVEVRMYQGHSPNCNKYVFVLNKGLSGIQNPMDIQAQIDKAVDEYRKQTELELLRKELKVKEEKIEELEAINEEKGSGVDKWVELLKEGKSIAGMFGLNTNKGLSGTPELRPEPNAEVSVEMDPIEVSKNRQTYNDMLEAFGEDKIKDALGLITVLSSHPELQEKLKEELNKLKNNEDGQA